MLINFSDVMIFLNLSCWDSFILTNSNCGGGGGPPGGRGGAGGGGGRGGGEGGRGERKPYTVLHT